ncbi:MAG: hypothetical protein COW27_04645 [Nitrosopumilales archaeon CG15_BIG_FIL_POST_REV_8_21_14_020_37_12]|nr:MAG: hypothetical protein COW27_04645 [Nitrosopumilales archaeon CG15_BIG_FIL_POST_REV_8_21_14_020_37_12]
MTINEKEEATKKILEVLEEWGSQSKFIWFRELHRITDIDKGLLRNIINELKKSKDVSEMKGDNKRIFYCRKKYYIKCRDMEYRFKGKTIMLKDGSRVKIIQGESKSAERTRRRIEKQKKKRQVKLFTRAQSKRRPHKS